MRNVLGLVVLVLALVGVGAEAAETVAVKVGEKRVLEVKEMTRIAVGDPQIADVRTLGGSQLEVTGAAPGKTTMLVWTKGGERAEYLLEVTGEAKALKAPAKAAQPSAGEETVTLRRGKTKSLTFPGLTRVAVGDPSIADVSVVGQGEVRVKGKDTGKTTLLVWTGSERRSYLIDVKP